MPSGSRPVPRQISRAPPDFFLVNPLAPNPDVEGDFLHIEAGRGSVGKEGAGGLAEASGTPEGGREGGGREGGREGG